MTEYEKIAAGAHDYTKPFIITKRITKKSAGRTLDTLEILWRVRDFAERQLSEHLRGETCDANTWAAVNLPNDAWDPANTHRPPMHWLQLKADWLEEAGLLAERANKACRDVRIATGHEPIGKMVCRPAE